jgi:hypothetical protein
LLQSDESLNVLAEGFRPWPKLEKAAKWYNDRATEDPDNLGVMLGELLRDYKKDDVEYMTILKKVLSLFGEGIHESLERTMGDFS